jgi:hypothetical protein
LTDSDTLRNFARRSALRVAPPLRRLLEEREQLQRRQRRLERMLAGQRRKARDLEQRVAELEASGGDGSTEGPSPRADLRYVFIVSYGRSGSTLVQGVLNAIPGYLIRGENRAAPFRLYQFHQGITAAGDRFSRQQQLTSRDSWYGIDKYKSGEALFRMRELVLRCLLQPEPGTRVTGFKEIRWFQPDWQDYLAFLRELFPGARFVINTRDHSGVVQSQWWTKMDPDAALAQLREHEQQFDKMAALLGEDAYRVHYDEYIADRGRLAGLFDWLGERFDRAMIDSVMDVRHSF